MKAAIALMVVLIGAALAFAIFEPIQVLPRLRLAPGYAFTTSTGGSLTSEDVRGDVTLYSFAGLDCADDCVDTMATMAAVQERIGTEVDLGAADFRLVSIVVDPDVLPAELATLAEAADAGDGWEFVGGTEAQLERTISDGFGRYYEFDGSTVAIDGGFLLVDGNGVLRGDYRYQTLADDADKLVRHIGLLGAEIRNSDGASAVAYEAAHLFLCYP